MEFPEYLTWDDIVEELLNSTYAIYATDIDKEKSIFYIEVGASEAGVISVLTTILGKPIFTVYKTDEHVYVYNAEKNSLTEVFHDPGLASLLEVISKPHYFIDGGDYVLKEIDGLEAYYARFDADTDDYADSISVEFFDKTIDHALALSSKIELNEEPHLDVVITPNKTNPKMNIVYEYAKEMDESSIAVLSSDTVDIIEIDEFNNFAVGVTVSDFDVPGIPKNYGTGNYPAKEIRFVDRMLRDGFFKLDIAE